jgi:hypothetical protein
MKRTLAGAGIALALAAALFFFGPFRQEQFQLIYQDGPRSLYLDTKSVLVQTTADGVRYLDVTVRQTYTFTADYDLTRYFLLTDAREYQPITATGCDKDGRVLEL